MIASVSTLTSIQNRLSGRLSRRGLLGRLAVGSFLATACRPLAPAARGGHPEPLTGFVVPHPLVPAQALIQHQIGEAATEVGATLTTRLLPSDEVQSAIQASQAAGQPPDLVLVDEADSIQLAATGQSVELREPLERIAGLNGDLFRPLRRLAAAGPFVDRSPHQPEPAWAIPYLSIGVAWLVRQDLLAHLQLALPKTFDDVRSIAQQLARRGGPAGWGSPLPLHPAGDDAVRLALLAHGATLLDPLGLQVALSADSTAAGLQALADLYRERDGAPLAPVGVLDWSPSRVEDAFQSGDLVQTIDFGGSYARLVTRWPALRERITALPPPAGPRGWYTNAPSRLWVVLRASRSPETATALLERLLRPDRYEALTRAGQGAVIPPYAYLTKGPFWDDDPNYAALATNARGDPARQLQNAPLGYPAPPTSPAARIAAAQLLVATARRVIAGESSATEAAIALGRQAGELARQALRLQPTPTPTPPPFWSTLVGALSTFSGGE